MNWRDAVPEALRRFSVRHSTRSIDRQQLIDEELDPIVRNTNSIGVTPAQTLSRVLQELRDEGIIEFISTGNYLLADAPFNVESEDLPDDALDFAIKNNKLALGILPASDQRTLARQRKGQERIRVCTLDNYDYQCAFCDINETDMLVASHISRWADDPGGRGDLSNLICMCKFQDALFERGYFSLADDYHILRKKGTVSQTIGLMLGRTQTFKTPKAYRPAPQFLQKHRARYGF